MSNALVDLRGLMVLFVMVLLSVGSMRATAEPDQTWLAFAWNGSVKDDSRWLGWFDGHARSRTESSQLGVSILRPAIGYQINDRLNLWAGYARVVDRRSGPDGEENRYWQQATYPIATVLGGSLTGRTRLEQRTFEGFSDTGHRVRQFFRWARPIAASDWSWVVANETFLAFSDADFGQQSGYQQNRLYAGLALQLAPKARVEVTYLNNHLHPTMGGSFANHNLSLALFANW